MSETQTRPSAPRGRGSGRGGRGGYSSRGGRGANRQINGDKSDAAPTTSYEDEGEIGQLKKQYASKLSTIKEMFPDWTSEDIVFALQETDGDLESTIERISEGNISQWGEVKKKTKDRARSNVKDSSTTHNETSSPSGRSARSRGISDGTRGGRGRATDRGRGTGRGSKNTAGVNGSRVRNSDKAAQDSGNETLGSAMVDSTSSWDTPAVPIDTPGDNWDQSAQAGNTSPDASWEMVTPSEAALPLVPDTQKPSLRPDGTRSWASMLKPAPKPVPVPVRQQPSKAPSQEPPMETTAPESEIVSSSKQGLPPPAQKEEPLVEAVESSGSPIPSDPPEVSITPSKDELTKTNLEQVLDTSAPPPTTTAASTVASTNDPRSTTATPLGPSNQQQSALRPILGGFATSAYKATAGSARTPSFQRRVIEQQEAVVMPGNHAVDRAAVQFGSMGLNGTSEDLDVDDDREEAETRAQPPQQSPVAPRASLPPAPQQAAADSHPTPRQAPGLPPAGSQASAQQASGQDQGLQHQMPQGNYSYNQFNRYGPPSNQQEPAAPAAPATKPYEPFGQQVQQPSAQQQQYDSYGSQSQAPTQQQQVAPQSQLGGYSSASNDYSSLYTSDNQRNAYQNYYGAYGQPSQQSQQDAGASQQRAGSGFGSTGAEQASQYITSQNQQPPQARYGAAVEAHNSGHSTPNPVPGQQAQTQIHGQQSHQMGQQQGHGQVGGQQGGYPYGNPYYSNSPYYSTYMNQVSHHSYGRERPMFDDVRRYDDQYLTHNHQYGYGGNQGGYGSGPYGAAGGKYGQPHQGYGMSPQSSYDQHSASPANAGGYGQQPHSMPGRDTSAVGSYGRTGSTQPTESQQQHAGSTGVFSGMGDVFSRSQSGYSGQSAPQQGAQQGSTEESSRSYGEASKVAGGPSPVPGQASGRPGSATNNMTGQSGIPTTQAQNQQAYGAYPQMHSQAYGTALGGVGGHHQAGGQSHQGSGYGGGYGSGFGGGNYYANNNRGGWGGNYGH